MFEAVGLLSPRSSIAAAVVLALVLDRWFGEPAQRWHPVVWMGRYLDWAGRRVAPRARRTHARPPAPGKAQNLKQFMLGALSWWGGAAIVLIVCGGVDVIAQRLPGWGAALLLGLALKPLLAWRMLQGEVLAVEAALGHSLEAGRTRLARLVSRDVSMLGAVEVRESAIESLAENLNDSVVAPVFWFALLGLPGAALYRFANTADAMWGYRGERDGRDWTWAGKWAARADDVLSWVPARLTALLLFCVSLPRGNTAVGRSAWTPHSWRTLVREAAKTPSPNSGWPMAAMALLLGVRLGKCGVYTLAASGRPPLDADLRRSVLLGARVVISLAVLGAVASALMAAGFLAA